MVCEVLCVLTGNPLFRALAYSGFFLNLFNLASIGVLDGRRIVTALSPWLWLVGATVMGALLVLHPNFPVGLILLVSLPRLWFLFRKKSDEQRRYFEVTPGRRPARAGMYFGLIGLLLLEWHSRTSSRPRSFRALSRCRRDLRRNSTWQSSSDRRKKKRQGASDPRLSGPP